MKTGHFFDYFILKPNKSVKCGTFPKQSGKLHVEFVCSLNSTRRRTWFDSYSSEASTIPNERVGIKAYFLGLDHLQICLSNARRSKAP